MDTVPIDLANILRVSGVHGIAAGASMVANTMWLHILIIAILSYNSDMRQHDILVINAGPTYFKTVIGSPAPEPGHPGTATPGACQAIMLLTRRGHMCAFMQALRPKQTGDDINPE